MPRKSSMRDNVNIVRSQLPDLSYLSREQIELALLYYESNIDDTVAAFKRDGAIEALNGWTEMSSGRGNASSRRTNNKNGDRNNFSLTLNTNTSSRIAPSNGILRPSQRVSNIFQMFAEGGIPTVLANGSTTISHTTSFSPSSISSSSSSFMERSENNHDLTNIHIATHNDTTEKQNSLQLPSEQTITNHHEAISSIQSNHELSTNANHHQNPITTFANNKKLLTKSAKDLQRQTSTLANVEILFNNEIKSSLKRIDDVYKQIHESIKQREVELYLEMDKVKEQGLNIIHNRQKRAIELRQRIDRCDRLEPIEIDNLRHDIKQFVTDGRYELGEELTTTHRFEYDQKIIELLKTFGRVLPIGRTHSTPSTLIEANASSSSTTTAAATTETSISDVTSKKVQFSKIDNRISSEPSSSSNEFRSIDKHEERLSQRISKQQSNDEVKHIRIHEFDTGDNHRNCGSSQQTDGSFQYYDESNSYQNGYRRRTQQNSQGNLQRPRPTFNYHNSSNRCNENKQINDRVGVSNNNRITNAYRRPRPPPHPSQTSVAVET